MKFLILLFTIFTSFAAYAENFEGQMLGDVEDIGIRYAAPLDVWKTPNYSEKEEQEILVKYHYLDPQHLIPTGALKTAVLFFHFNNHLIPNKNYLSLINFKAHSGQRRFFLIDMHTGAVEAIHVAHGTNSDKDNDGLATQFSNINGSLQSSLGFYMAAEQYSGKYKNSMRWDGLSASNSLVRERAIVFHGATYVKPSLKKMGMSWGCTAVDNAIKDRIIQQLKDGSIMYAFY